METKIKTDEDTRRVLYYKDSGFKIRYTSKSGERIKIYVGNFREEQFSGRKIDYEGAKLLIDGQVFRTFTGPRILEDFLSEESKEKIKSFKSKKSEPEVVIRFFESKNLLFDYT